MATQKENHANETYGCFYVKGYSQYSHGERGVVKGPCYPSVSLVTSEYAS